MTPNTTNVSQPMMEQVQQKSEKSKKVIMWRNIYQIGTIHLLGFYGFTLMFTSAKLLTTLYTFSLYWFGMFGIVAGVHRYWSHNSYKVKLPLKLIFFIAYTTVWMGPIINWVRDHRVHHKFIDSDADPYNAKRGFFFSHVGWLLVKRHPNVHIKGKTIDYSDLYADPLLRFQKKYYLIIAPIINFYIPALIPIYLWNETLWNTWFVAIMFRNVLLLNVTWTINSLAHYWGTKPYKQATTAVDTFFGNVITFGEGWHNYHHTFPTDYRGGEFPSYGIFSINSVTEFFKSIGWLYNTKIPSRELIESVKLNRHKLNREFP